VNETFVNLVLAADRFDPSFVRLWFQVDVLVCYY